jgi:hypothetical protein
MADELFLPTEADLNLLNLAEVEGPGGDAPALGDPEPPPEIDATELQQLREKAAIVDRFYGDQTYMRQVILQAAPALGLRLAPAEPSTPAGAPSGSQGSAPPAQFVANLRARLGDQLAFMAEPLASAVWDAQQQTLAPLQERQQALQQDQRDSEYQTVAAQLSQEIPGWDSRENDMLQIMQFLRGALNGGSLRHPRYGSALKLLYSLATGNGQATATAAQRQGQAARNATRTGMGGARSPAPNLEEQLRKLPSFQTQMEAAFKDTIREMGITSF